MQSAPNGAATLPTGNATPPHEVADHLGVARSFADIGRIVADYCEQIGMSRAALDAEAFIGSGHAAKALARRARKRLGWTTLGRVLGRTRISCSSSPALPTAQIPASSVASRNGSSRDHHWRNVKGSAWGRRMAAMRNLKLTGPRRTEIARHAAQVRHRGTIATTPGNANTTPQTSPHDTAANQSAPAPSLRRQGSRQLTMFGADLDRS